MNLSGTLGPFGLGDMLALMASGRRSGVVRLRRPGRTGAVWCSEGHVSGASPDESQDGLLRRLVAVGQVDAAQLAAAIESGSPVNYLTNSPQADQAIMRRAISDHLVDSVCELMAWPTGQFEVSLDELDPQDVGLRMQLADLLAAVSARTPRWEAVWRVLPDLDAVPWIPGDLPAHQSIAMDPVSFQVLAAVDGRGTVREVCQSVPAGPLLASQALLDLLNRGLVELDGHRDRQVGDLLEAQDRYRRARSRARTARADQPDAPAGPTGSPQPTDPQPEHPVAQPTAESDRVPRRATQSPAESRLPDSGAAQGSSAPPERRSGGTASAPDPGDDDPPPPHQAGARSAWRGDLPEPLRPRGSHAAPEPPLPRQRSAGEPPSERRWRARPAVPPDQGATVVSPAPAARSGAAVPAMEEEADLESADGLSRGLLMQLIAGLRGL